MYYNVAVLHKKIKLISTTMDYNGLQWATIFYKGNFDHLNL